MPSIFGEIIDGAQVEDIVENFLQRWLPIYLAELADQRGESRDIWLQEGPQGNWPPSWSRKAQFDYTEETRLPAIITISAGIAGPPFHEGDGTYHATWMIGVAVLVSAKDQESTNLLVKRYGAAIRWMFIQHPSLEDPNVEGATWEDEAYDDIGVVQNRTLASARMVFSIQMKNVANSLAGPVLPDDPPPDPTTPYDEWPILEDIDHVHIQVKEMP
jgi:hypothetical protein